MWYHFSVRMYQASKRWYTTGRERIMIAYMPRDKKPTTTRSTRLLLEVAEALDSFADDQMISANAAINKLLKEKLTEIGYIKPKE